MAGKKTSRTSKTDHVLSLLAGAGAGHGEAPAVSENKPEAAPEHPTETIRPAQAPAQERHLAPPILEVARLHNEALSETIREALTQSLEQELDQEKQEKSTARSEKKSCSKPEPSIPEAAPSTEEFPPAEVIPVVEENPDTQVTSSAREEMAAETPAEERFPDAEKAPTAKASPAPAGGPGSPLPDGSIFLNVMEILVEERLEKYVKLFGLCDCPRCLADVRALALSRLPAKYVVLPAAAVTPMLSLYQAKFDSMVVAQVIQACKSVMESPRHTR